MNHRATTLGLILGLALGLLASATDIGLLDRLADGVAPLGTLFINAIRMVVIPLVVTTIFVGVARIGNPKAVGKLGGSAFGFFWGTTVPAIVIGLAFMTIAMAIWPVAIEVPTTVEDVQELPGLLDLVLRLIPTNPFAAAAEGALLPLIVFTLLMAAAAGAVEEARRLPADHPRRGLQRGIRPARPLDLVDRARGRVRTRRARGRPHGARITHRPGRVRGDRGRGAVRVHGAHLPAGRSNTGEEGGR